MKQKLEQQIADVLTVDQTARILKLHPNTVRRHAESGALLGVKLGSAWRFSATVIEQLVRGEKQ